MRVYNFKILLVVSILIVVGKIYAQPNPTDSVSLREYNNAVEDSNQNSSIFLPADVALIPADLLYNHLWNNDFIRVQINDRNIKDDTMTLYFNTPGEKAFTYPCNCKLISPFGYRGSHLHAGVDLKLNQGDPVYAAFDGKVRLAKYSRGYGNVVVIRHYNGLETTYAHLSQTKVKVNQDVKSGDLVGLGGRTGRATTAHLHFETRFLCQAFNPEQIIDIPSRKLKSDIFLITSQTFRIGGNQDISMRCSDSDSGIVEKPVNQTVYHTVKKGDTLYSLARNNKTTVQEICRLNHITPKTVLKLGRRLRIK